jgi:hypothetical protein
MVTTDMSAYFLGVSTRTPNAGVAGAAAVKAGVLPQELVQQCATPEESAAQILILVDKGTRDTDEFKSVEGSVRPW